VLTREIPAWLGHTHVTVKPVIDLTDQVAFDAYEHPGSLTERITLRTPADTFPHANQVTRRLDHDHAVPFAPDEPGQTGQTGDHNTQPLGRTGHRAKTHTGYQVRQLGPGDYLWQTPTTATDESTTAAPRSSPNPSDPDSSPQTPSTARSPR